MVTSRALQKPLFDLPVPSLADVHTSKRGERERGGVYAWHPYYAGYAEQFVADALSVLAEPGDLVLDPWNGSGTTTLVAHCKGFPSIGVEINPVMALHAQAKNPDFSQRADDLRAQTRALVAAARQLMAESPAAADDIADWVHDEPLTALLAIRDAIREHVADEAMPDFVADIIHPGAKDTIHPSKEKAFFLSALFQVLRKVGKFSRASNPTWLIPDDHAASTPAETVFGLFLTRVEAMLTDLEMVAWRAEEVDVDHASSADYWVMTGDARALDLQDASVDLIITSPPYCTRIDYAFSTKPELLLLGDDEGEVDALRRATMGAPVIVDKSIVPRRVWGPTCNDFLDAVAEHPSKSSKSYYLPTYLQYFRDAEHALREIKRVLGDDGKAVVVVQSSYYKEVELPLGEIYVEMSTRLDFDAEIARRETVRQHMAHINTRSRQYLKDKAYYEDVVLLTK